MIYGDPAPSQRRTAAGGSYKAVWLTGMFNDVLYVIKGRLFRGLNDDFISAYFHLFRYAGAGTKVPVYCFMENNSLQDPFFQQVYKVSIRFTTYFLEVFENIWDKIWRN
jgi:hypothetical protein